jgi:hypothetical protein
MADEQQIRNALAYFRKVPANRITSVYISQQVGDIVTVSYRGPKGRKRTVDLDLSKQHMKMFEVNNEQETAQDETQSISDGERISP